MDAWAPGLCQPQIGKGFGPSGDESWWLGFLLAHLWIYSLTIFHLCLAFRWAQSDSFYTFSSHLDPLYTISFFSCTLPRSHRLWVFLLIVPWVCWLSSMNLWSSHFLWSFPCFLFGMGLYHILFSIITLWCSWKGKQRKAWDQSSISSLLDI